MRKIISLGLIVFIFLVLIDQLSKYLIRSQGGFSVVCNKNIAFGINIPSAVFWILWIVIIAFLITLLYKKSTSRYSLFIIFILSGAISNIIDRLYFGCVIDFINLKVWPVFNLADSFIALGVIMIMLSKLNSKHLTNNS